VQAVEEPWRAGSIGQVYEAEYATARQDVPGTEARPGTDAGAQEVTRYQDVAPVSLSAGAITWAQTIRPEVGITRYPAQYYAAMRGRRAGEVLGWQERDGWPVYVVAAFKSERRGGGLVFLCPHCLKPHKVNGEGWHPRSDCCQVEHFANRGGLIVQAVDEPWRAGDIAKAYMNEYQNRRLAKLRAEAEARYVHRFDGQEA